MSPIAGLLSRLPLRLLHALGAALGWGAYFASPGYRRHLRENLARAFPQAGLGQRLAAAAHAGRLLGELPAVWLRPRAQVAALVTRLSGWELVEQARAQGRGILFLTPHLGCFEIAARYCAQHAPITVLYQPPKLAWLRPLVESGRGGADLHLASADLAGVRALMRALKRREAIGILPDQVPGKGEGQWLDFFGRPAYTMTLAARLSQSAGVVVLLAFAERLPAGAGYHLSFMPPPEPIAGDLEERAAAINRALEALIRSCPEQYLWGYNRYKRPAGAPPPPC